MPEEISRVIVFSSDERMYSSDVEGIIAAARAFPNSKVFCYEPWWTRESQTFVLAESPKEAMEILIAYCGKHNQEEVAKMTESDFD